VRMPILILHIIAGSLGVLSGFVAMSLRKGSRWHALAGQIFVGAMLTMSGCGVCLAILKSQPGNILGGMLTFYLVATAWMVARHPDGRSGILDWAALLVVLAVASTELTFAVQAAYSVTGMKYDYPPAPYLIFGVVGLLGAVGDVRLLWHGSISGSQRLARHLWRMCFGLFIASASVFLARQHLFPELLRKTGALYVLSFLPLIVMIVWLVRVSFMNGQKRKALAGMHA